MNIQVHSDLSVGGHTLGFEICNYLYETTEKTNCYDLLIAMSTGPFSDRESEERKALCTSIQDGAYSEKCLEAVRY